MRYFITLLFVAISFLSMPLWARESVCQDVFISSVHPLDLGVMRMRTGDTGWVFIDGSGFATVSDFVSHAANQPISAGMIRVRAPEKSMLTLSLVLIDPDYDRLGAKAFDIKSLHIYGDNNVKILQIYPGTFEVTLPESLSRPSARLDTPNLEVSTDLQIGVEARLTGVSKRIDTNYSIAVSCLAIDNLSL